MDGTRIVKSFLARDMQNARLIHVCVSQVLDIVAVMTVVTNITDVLKIIIVDVMISALGLIHATVT